LPFKVRTFGRPLRFNCCKCRLLWRRKSVSEWMFCGRIVVEGICLKFALSMLVPSICQSVLTCKADGDSQNCCRSSDLSQLIRAKLALLRRHICHSRKSTGRGARHRPRCPRGLSLSWCNRPCEGPLPFGPKVLRTVRKFRGAWCCSRT